MEKMLTFRNEDSDLYVPDGEPLPGALTRTTHLAVGAHQDDLEIMAFHGIQACFGRKDRRFTGVTVTAGRGSPRGGPYAGCPDGEMARIRRTEQRKAALVGDYGAQIQLGYASREVKEGRRVDVERDLAGILDATRPEAVYLHNPADKHDTHVAVAMRSIAALRALEPAARPSKVYGCEIWRNLDWLPDREKEALPLSGRGHLAAALLGIFDSQIEGGKRYDLAAAGRWLANATFFESHEVDEAAGLLFAMDLTPLVRDPALSVSEYVLGFVDRFRQEVAQALERFA